MSRLVLVIFFIEVGLVLTLAPWSAYWDRNYFAETLPAVRSLITNNFVRGAITGLGVINICAAVVELIGLFASRRRADDVAIARSQPAEE
jgi:hypothetical protein